MTAVSGACANALSRSATDAEFKECLDDSLKSRWALLSGIKLTRKLGCM